MNRTAIAGMNSMRNPDSMNWLKDKFLVVGCLFAMAFLAISAGLALEDDDDSERDAGAHE